MKSLKKYLSLCFIIPTLSFMTVGCDNAGNEAEDAVEEAADAVDDAADATVDAAEGAADEVEDEM